jgi:hypothetical protein
MISRSANKKFLDDQEFPILGEFTARLLATRPPMPPCPSPWPPQPSLDPALAERERALRIPRAEAPRLRVQGIRRLSLFGALARGDAAPESDVDL